MIDAYVIEIAEEAVGLVVREEQDSRQKKGFRFYASVKDYQSLDGEIFPNPESAQRTAMIMTERLLNHTKSLTSAKAEPKYSQIPVQSIQINPIDLSATC